MKSILKKIKTYMKEQDYTPINTAVQLYSTYGTFKNERILNSLRLFKEERLAKYV